MSTQLPVARLAIHTLASLGVSKVINDVITNNTVVETSADAVKVWAGSVVLGSILVDATSKHVNDKMDAVATWYASRKAATPAQ
jgi:hypothetical protein